ncbi:MAG: DNA topoisomerase [Lachnospiraceae bacterium]|nr:DNA topoisomerase [Lachnospiraceae bacterium]
MPKSLYIAEKPSVAQEFAKALRENMGRRDGYLEGEHSVVTWCVGHLVTMSYPDAYDPALKRWSFETIPFLPKQFKYEVIPQVKKQFAIVQELLNRKDVETIYVCTDSGREGEYIYRLVAMMAGVKDKNQKRVWIDSQTEEEILRGIREAKDLSEYDNLSASAYLRAKEDYLMGINFSRALSLKYSNSVTNFLGGKYQAIAVGRVMTCVLGMVVRREREIRNFDKTPFYRVISNLSLEGNAFTGEWRAVEGSRYYQSPLLYKENGFRKRPDAERLIRELETETPEVQVKTPPPAHNPRGERGEQQALVDKVEKKKETKNAPLLYNLAELQNECSRRFKISPDQTLSIVQELYEKKLVTYPRTDARVLSSAVAKEIYRNIKGLTNYPACAEYAGEVLEGGSYKGIAKTRYTNDKQITDHYAIIPTGQGIGSLGKLSDLSAKVYDLIVRRFLSIFYPPAVYRKISVETLVEGERFFSSFRILEQEGYLKVAGRNTGKTKPAKSKADAAADPAGEDAGTNSSPKAKEQEEEITWDKNSLPLLMSLKKGQLLPVSGYEIREGETSPPKRYTSGSMILAMENAGQLIEDEELRAQIKGSGIGTSATRAEILKKLVSIKYLSLNKKTQVITPTQMGEMIHDVVFCSIRALLNPELTASWEKGLTYVADGSITEEEYMKKLEGFVAKHTNNVKQLNNQTILNNQFNHIAQYYKKRSAKKA